jgi:cyclopropane-fatty-acyl-phospholipid synthase
VNPAAFAADQAARQVVLRTASRLESGELSATLPGGKRRTYGRAGSTPAASIRIHDNAFFRRVLLGGEIAFGETYVDGLWDSDDLVGLLLFGIGAREHLQFNQRWLSAISRVRDVRWHRGRRNTKEAAQENIHAHYDLGNEFFRLWLDETMTYSCAYFEHPEQGLADAQRNKYARICAKAKIATDDHVLEIGCGWGGFATYAASQFGCRVTAITISEEQYDFARARVAEAGLSELVDVQFRDYRDVRGEFDAIVSIEMLEAVGAEYFEEFFLACDRGLVPGGRLAVQTISVPDRSFAALRDGVNWMQKYIFPGGMLPSISEIERAIRRTGLVIDGLEDIGLHYARTLRRWRERFIEQQSAIRELGFDDRFCRLWEYYLAASEAGFITRNTGDLQIVFQKVSGHGHTAARQTTDEQHLIPPSLAR